MDVALSNAIINTATNMASAQKSDAVNIAVLKKALDMQQVHGHHHDRRHGAGHAPAALAPPGALGTQVNTLPDGYPLPACGFAGIATHTKHYKRNNIARHAMHMLKLTQIGNLRGHPRAEGTKLKSYGIGLKYSPYDPALEEEITAGREFMREYRDTPSTSCPNELALDQTRALHAESLPTGRWPACVTKDC